MLAAKSNPQTRALVHADWTTRIFGLNQEHKTLCYFRSLDDCEAYKKSAAQAKPFNAKG
jgi:hypothetical protein